MSRRTAAPLVLRDYQQAAAERLAAAAQATLAAIAQAPGQRRRIMREAGCTLLEAPTGSGKTVIVAATAEAVSRAAPVVWFWFAPFAGLVGQTAAALRAAAPGLRVRDPAKDRADTGTRPGDVFIATWASVAARRKETRRMREDDDTSPALDTLVAALREAGLRIGAVVDEAHHSFRPNTEAFRFFTEVLDPDLLFCATATPDDADVALLAKALGVRHFQRVSVSRDSVVAARLNKKRVRAVNFVARGADAKLLDLNEVALREAVKQHRALKAALAHEGFPIVPLLLVQAASTAWTPERVRGLLIEKLGFARTAVGTHTAAEPDADVQALANDPAVEVLVFKMAVATGFDAPRASVLCALRPVVDAGFGMQVIGRIMRVHPLLQPRRDLDPALDTAWVFLGDAQGQQGLQTAADRIQALRDAIDVVSDRVHIYEAEVGADGALTVADASGQRALTVEPELEPQSWGGPAPPSGAAPAPGPQSTLLGKMAGFEERQSAAPAPASGGITHGRYRYHRRPGVVAPRCLRTEKPQLNAAILLDQLIDNVRFSEADLNAARQVTAKVTVEEADLFAREPRVRREERAQISDLFAQQHALTALSVTEYIGSRALGERLQAALATAFRDSGQEPPEGKPLRRALDVVLVRNPHLLRDALRRAANACVEVIDAADLPDAWESDTQLMASPLNLYGCMPHLNTWETRFAEWLDAQGGTVLWWSRNPSRPNAHDDWSARIVLPDTGRGYYPDFVVCVAGRKAPNNIGLAETKHATDSAASAAKSRTEHREYGRALMVKYEPTNDRFIVVEYDPALGRNKDIAPLRVTDLVH
jgi:hypothetical protein